MPLVPTTVSSAMAATVWGPSTISTSDRCCSARSVSSASLVEWKALRYGYGPQNFTAPAMPGSLGQRRGSPVSVMAPAVAPW